MFLTRMQLNPARRGTRHLLTSQQRMHAAVLSGFPPHETEEGQGRVLWRLDRLASQRLDLYVVSPQSPDLTCLVEQAGWPTTHTWETRTYQPLLERLEKGQRWRFRLTANPVRSLAQKTGRGKVAAHVTVGQQEEWLLSRAEPAGFAVAQAEAGAVQLLVKDRRALHFRRGDDGQGRQVSIATATFEGVLEITDAEVLRQTLVRGLGRAKAYGCGLMTLARTP